MAKAPGETTLPQELLSARLFKPSQGRVVRQVTAIAIAVVGAIAAWQLRSTVLGSEQYSSAMRTGIPAVLLVLGVWFAFRIVNWPSFANFLIQVEGEMDKVTWASWDYLKRATGIVLVVMLLLGAYLFAWDILWQRIFTWIGFLEIV
ncbi:MAG: preprotein translocase subunit SecE [Planctomycetaceae bacterium]|nr:preprotein translocase subunit SecE [Planctomycetaceae bacterium]MCB9952192.1 preprotein translocase subunit SecE [Planctomycetaceae bacterium]